LVREVTGMKPKERYYRFRAPRRALLALRGRLVSEGRYFKTWVVEVLEAAARGEVPTEAPPTESNGGMRWVSLRLRPREVRAYERAQHALRAQGRTVAWLLRTRIAEEVHRHAGSESVPVVRR
jgi:hypothetical protein